MKQNKFEVSNDVFPSFISDDLKPEFFEGMVTMAYHLNINGKKLGEQLAYEYMKYIYENVSTSNAFIRSHTGYKRTTVENFKKKYESSKLAGQKKETSIFNEFIHKLKSECTKNENLSFPIHGDNSCHSIFSSCKFSKNNTFTVNSVLSTLEKCGFIKVHDKHVTFTPSINEEVQRTDDDINRQFSNMVRDFSSTQIHNMHEDEKDKRLFSQRVNTIDVPDELINLTANQLREFLSVCQKQCFDQIEENEDPSNKNSKSYQMGVQQFVYIVKRGKK